MNQNSNVFVKEVVVYRRFCFFFVGMYLNATLYNMEELIFKVVYSEYIAVSSELNTLLNLGLNSYIAEKYVEISSRAVTSKDFERFGERLKKAHEKMLKHITESSTLTKPKKKYATFVLERLMERVLFYDWEKKRVKDLHKYIRKHGIDIKLNLGTDIKLVRENPNMTFVDYDALQHNILEALREFVKDHEHHDHEWSTECLAKLASFDQLPVSDKHELKKSDKLFREFLDEFVGLGEEYRKKEVKRHVAALELLIECMFFRYHIIALDILLEYRENKEWKGLGYQIQLI